MLKTIVLFSLAGLAEIGVGCFIWLWLREGKPLLWGLLGGIVLNGLRSHTNPAG